MSLKRLFFGLELSDEARDALDHLRPSLEGFGHPYNRDLYHLTLCFLGMTDESALPALSRWAHLSDNAPFDLTLNECGTFKDGRILWVGVLPSTPLTIMQSKLSCILRENGFQMEETPYTPHITLGRSMKRIPFHIAPRNVTFTVHGITLFESLRENDRLVYRPLYRTW